jgi:hypothetical protein
MVDTLDSQWELSIKLRANEKIAAWQTANKKQLQATVSGKTA